MSPDSTFLFSRMTNETIQAVDARRGERILDVGCGRGHDLAALGVRGASLFGLDGSRVMIRKAAATSTEKGIPLQLACGSAERLPFADCVFHDVYCKGAIDHFYDPAAAVREMERVLRPGGRLVISVANFESLGCRMGRLFNHFQRAICGRELPRPHFWEMPEDHCHKFGQTALLELLPEGLPLRMTRGISLLWGFPHWGGVLKALPGWLSNRILRRLDRLAAPRPAISDVIVLRAERRADYEKDQPTNEFNGTDDPLPTDGEEIMKRYSRLQGLLLCLATIVAAVLFLVGIFMKNYWALAIPVAIGFLWLLGLGFWIGLTLLTIKVEPHEDQSSQAPLGGE